ncbi:MAG: GSCFA domain-containing protein [Bacteroidales bacterium]|nr:GSCFA domain-containing protein [Bacteroidales bacterium]
MKLFTEVHCEKNITIAHSDPVCVLGSCFADEMGARLAAAGFDVLRNPFGTLYNPASLAAAVARLDGAEPFTQEDCVEMGAGAGLVCSFSHHTAFARPTAEEFLAHANARLSEDAARWRDCRVVLLTLGTAWVWRALERPGQPVVANCLKRPAREFAHELLSVEACAELLRSIIEAHPEKRFLLTVSPIRHLGAGAHANTISKSTLHLAVEQVLSSFGGLTGESPVAYFPAYEILTDELRDYRFYADDLVHPAPAAVQFVWERFLDACTDPADRERIHDAERASRAASHRTLR